MADDKKLVEVMLDVLAEIHEMRKGIDTTNKRLEKLENTTNKRFDKLEKQMVLNNKAIGELRLSILKLAENQNQFKDHDRRLRKVEMTLAKNKLL